MPRTPADILRVFGNDVTPGAAETLAGFARYAAVNARSVVDPGDHAEQLTRAGLIQRTRGRYILTAKGLSALAC